MMKLTSMGSHELHGVNNVYISFTKKRFFSFLFFFFFLFFFLLLSFSIPWLWVTPCQALMTGSISINKTSLLVVKCSHLPFPKLPPWQPPSPLPAPHCRPSWAQKAESRSPSVADPGLQGELPLLCSTQTPQTFEPWCNNSLAAQPHLLHLLHQVCPIWVSGLGHVLQCMWTQVGPC